MAIPALTRRATMRCFLSRRSVYAGGQSNMARMNVRQMWAAKLAGRAGPAGGALAANAATTAAGSIQSRPRAAFAGVVLGIDPSLRGTGLALIEFAAGRQPTLLR